MMKKRIICFLVTGILLSGLMACDNPSPAKDSSADESPDIVDDVVEKTESDAPVSVMAWWEGGEQEAGKAKVAACEEELGVKIEANYVIYDEYLSKLNTLAAAGEMPDVFALQEFLVFDWGEKGMLMDLAEGYDNMGVNMEEKYLPNSIFRNQDRVWAIGYDLTTLFLYYNKEMFDDAGIAYPPANVDSPWTWDQYVDAAKKMTKDSAGLTPNDDGFNPNDILIFGTKMPSAWSGFMPLLYSNGSGILDETGTELLITKAEGIEVIQAVADLSQKEYCAPDVAIADGAFSDSSTMLMNSQLGMLIDGGWAFSNYKNEGFDVGIAPIPMFKKPADMSWTCGFTISADTKNPENALKVHAWFTDFSKYIDACETAGVSLGGLPQSLSVYENETYLEKWANLHSQEMVDVCTSILQSDSNRLGENVTVKNFGAIVDDTLMPQLDKVWLGEMTAKDALSAIENDLAGKASGLWIE